MTEKTTPTPSNPKLQTINIPIQAGVTADEARKILQDALRKIPDQDLKNFRGGQITIVS